MALMIPLSENHLEPPPSVWIQEVAGAISVVLDAPALVLQAANDPVSDLPRRRPGPLGELLSRQPLGRPCMEKGLKDFPLAILQGTRLCPFVVVARPSLGIG